MPLVKRLRIMTYNVHRCVGRDGVFSADRIAAAIDEQEPDVVGLQELDLDRARVERPHQVAHIAGVLKMDWLFHPAHVERDEHFGDALLSRYPMELVRAAVLPTLPNRPRMERRSALWVNLHWDVHAVQVITTHLGLYPREQLAQAEALLRADWLGHPLCKPPVVLCGDLNAVPGTRTYRRLRTRLRDPFPWGSWPLGTFPSGCPLLRLDHVLLSANWIVHRADVPRTRLTRVASDHLPVVVDVSLP
jgi:endonuclease/exonuclease/phosphatase family metal-dependent hydrolase